MTQVEQKVLDHGYVRYIEHWGIGEAMESEAAIIEAARQSTQGSFRGWNIWHCNKCGYNFTINKIRHSISGEVPTEQGLNNWDSPLCDQSAGWSNDEKLLGFMFRNNHSTPFEFCGMTIEVKAPIIVFREWHRHRTQSYNEMSARYAPLPNENYIPSIDRVFLTQEKNKQAQAMEGAKQLSKMDAQVWQDNIKILNEQIERIYQHGLAIGIPKELARVILPVGRYSKMRASANLRNWLSFLTLRMNPNAQWEIRQYANAVGEIIKITFPRTWKLFEETLEVENVSS